MATATWGSMCIYLFVIVVGTTNSNFFDPPRKKHENKYFLRSPTSLRKTCVCILQWKCIQCWADPLNPKRTRLHIPTPRLVFRRGVCCTGFHHRQSFCSVSCCATVVVRKFKTFKQKCCSFHFSTQYPDNFKDVLVQL